MTPPTTKSECTPTAAPAPSDWRRGLAAIAAEPANKSIVHRFFRFAGALAVVPVFVYFATAQCVRRLVEPHMLPQGVTPHIIGGVAAVFTVNLVTGVFALLAVREPLLREANGADGADKKDE